MQVQDYEMTKEDANGGTTIRAWLNGTFQAIATNNSGDEEPVTTYPFMWWVDTNNSDIYFLKMRNHANSEWLTLCAFTVVDGEIVFNVTKAQVGLSNVDNTSDALKPLSDAAIAALALKLSIATSALCTQVSVTDDPNNATQEYILTKHANCPDANVSYWYIHTIFYTSQTSTSARTQTAYSYSGTNAVYIRHNSSGAWTAWTRVDSVVVDATSSAKGIVELATNAEVIAGTDTVRVVTPAGMKAGLNASGTAPVYATRAWVNFNGTGTVAIRASGNVSSITDNGPGLYTVNFITPMPDVNYAICATGSRNSGATNYNPTPNIMSQATDSCQIRCHDQNSDTATDALYVNISIFR